MCGSRPPPHGCWIWHTNDAGGKVASDLSATVVLLLLLLPLRTWSLNTTIATYTLLVIHCKSTNSNKHTNKQTLLSKNFTSINSLSLLRLREKKSNHSDRDWLDSSQTTTKTQSIPPTCRLTGMPHKVPLLNPLLLDVISSFFGCLLY